MVALQIPFDSFGAQRSFVGWEFHPRLEANEAIVLHFELDATLHAAKATVCFDEAIGLDCGCQDGAAPIVPVRAEVLDDVEGCDGARGHGEFFLSAEDHRMMRKE